MSIFQKSVILKHLANLDKVQVGIAFQKLKENYSPAKIEQIKELKEEEYQDGFLRDIFVDVLGYTLKPNENYNLAREYKNLANSKKADGAILKEEKAIAVIELKSVKTKDLKSITDQAFNYKNNQPECKYVITSNFQKLRFYIDYANEYEEFDLFNIEKDDFDLLYLLLSKESIFQNLPLKLKEETKFHEQEISDKLYKDYSQFKRKLFDNLCKNHPESDKLTLFRKSQKLLDRFLFILFAEDSQLLPPNSISRIVERFELLKDEDAYKPLYEIFKQYFGYMNIGRKGKTSDGDIPAYNGGLFYPDELLDGFHIDDDVLIADLINLSKYDFSAEVDVNILGHIFEHSLNEIEEITAEIEGTAPDKTKSKRKKDGVFYTPKYITQYIVDNTIGTLCTEKRKELEIDTIEFDGSYRTKDKNLTVKGKKLYQKLTNYKEWLISLKIIDPACGSGAFLNQALNFLIEEHKTIDDIIAELTNTPLRLFDVDKTILENNLYGVDINEESVEIAKLSLWLRTAQKGRMLSTLNNNIKCGNSLIDDPEVAGDKAFDWNKEFPEIMKKGGFDVVIGNPPYVNINTLSKDTHQYFKKEYSTIHTGYNDLMYYFLYKGIDMLKKEGVLGVITSNYFIGNEYAKSLRGFLSMHVSEILNFGDYLIFEDANVHTTLIFAEKDQKNKAIKYSSLKNTKERLLSIEPNRFNAINKDRESLDEYWIFASNDKNQIIEKIAGKGKLLGQLAEIEKGSTSGKNDVFTVSKEMVTEYNLESEILRKNVKNGDILKYGIHDRETFLIYTDNDTKIEKYPNILNYLIKHKEALSNRNEVKKGSYDWWRMERPRRKEVYDANEKIIVPYRATNNRFAYDNERRFNDGGDIRVILIKDENLQIKYVLGVLNSNLIDWYYGFIGKPKGNAREYFNEPLAKIPIFLADNNVQTSITKLVDFITERIERVQIVNNKFTKYLQSQFPIEKLPNKLQNWYELDFGDFIVELNKAIKIAGGEKLSKTDEMDWMEVFESKKAEPQTLKAEIDKTDKEIDQMVYALYELTEEEIEIVKASVK